MRIRLLRTLLPFLLLSIIAVSALTACGSSSKPSYAKTPTTTAQNADGCAAGTTIPQGGGADHDADNSGGPSDGDGCA